VFQTAGLIHPRVRTALLARELLNKKGTRVDLRIGTPIAGEKLLAIATDEERIQYLRWRTYLLATRNQFKPKTSLPLAIRKSHPSPVEPIAQAVNPAMMFDEIASLSPDRYLAKSGDLVVYLAPAGLVPSVLREIGRLREITFRAVGEGTGRAADIDAFDAHYLHLFVWNEKESEVVGAYRLGATDVIQRKTGLKGLYTASLFKYDDAFLARLGPALELGRSFVRAEYQKAFAPLLLLWKGIGKYVASNPRYKVLFGPVSISNQYQSISRELMVSFLERHASVRELVGLVSNRNPFRRHGAARMQQPDVPNTVFGIDELSDVVSDLEPNRAGLPVLLRQYLRLGGRLLGFNVDPEFANALDGLILVDLTRTEPKLLDRYLGAAQAAQFLAFQREHNGTH
jgi:putative hemolysin